jgi:hypothetical protein
MNILKVFYTKLIFWKHFEKNLIFIIFIDKKKIILMKFEFLNKLF